MLRNSEGETEILLGNKQLLGLFVVVVLLLGIAFTGGYKMGQGSRKAVSAAAAAPATDETSGASTGTGGVTQQLPGETGSGAGTTASPATEAGAPPPATRSAADEDASRAVARQAVAQPPAPSPSARPKPKREETRDLEASGPARPAEVPVREAAGFAPQSGQMFLQVAAVTRDEAEGIAEVLRKKGFHAHAVPKPGAPRVYRVIIGPVRDASDLNSTRSQLRNNAGFREIIVQHY